MARISDPALPLAALVLAAASGAQVPQDTWAASFFTLGSTPGRILLVSPDRATVTAPTGQSADSVGANCVAADGSGNLYYGTLNGLLARGPNPGHIFMMVVQNGAVVAETKLTAQAPDSGSITGLTLRGEQLWYVTDAGSIGWLPLPSSAGTPPPYAPNQVFNLATQGGVASSAQSITTDGREIFVGTAISASSTDVFSIWALDTANPTTVRGVALPARSSVFAMSLGRDGQILAGLLGGRLYSVDPVTGASTLLNAQAPAPQGNANGSFINPWTNLVGVVPGSGSPARQLDHFDVSTGAWLPNRAGGLLSAVPTGVGCAIDQPFELFGHGCATAHGAEPRLRWTGLPVAGQSFSLTLRDAEPGLPAIAILGFSALPSGGIPLTPIGAPGCVLWMSGDASVIVNTNANGNASFSLAVPPGIPLGVTLYAQWATLSSVNRLGVVTTEAVRVRCR